MTSKTSSLLIPGIMCMIIGFLLFHVLGAAFGLIIGLAMGEQFYQRHELEKQANELQTEEKEEG